MSSKPAPVNLIDVAWTFAETEVASTPTSVAAIEGGAFTSFDDAINGLWCPKGAGEVVS